MGNVVVLLAAAVIAAGAGLVLRAAVFHHAVPADDPWRTGCPGCAAPLVRAGSLWFASALRPTGTCPACGTRVGAIPWLVEGVTAAVVTAIAWRHGVSLTSLALAWAALLSVVLGFVDVAVHRLPDRLILAALGGTLAGLAAATIAGQPGTRLVHALVSGAAACLAYLVIALLPPGGMGAGDLKLAALTGLVAGWFGYRAAFYAVAGGFFYAGLVAIPMMLAGRASRKTMIPHGPFMLLGALTVILVR